MNVKFRSIEGLRGWMAWWVVLAHALQLTGVSRWLHGPLTILLQSSVAVNVFIIVSGFVITHLLLNARESYAQYIWRRFLRIAPIYFFCLIVAISLTAWYAQVFVDLPWSTARDSRIERLAETQSHWWAHLLAHATLLHGLIPATLLKFSPSSFLTPAWSLSLEWQFYLIAPLIMAAMLRSLRAACATIAVLLIAAAASRIGVKSLYDFPAMLLLSIQYFLVGIVSRLVLARLKALPVDPGVLLLAVLPIAAFAHSLWFAIWLLFCIFMLQESGLLAQPSRAFSLVQYLLGTNPLIRALGKFSYSTYLLHIPLFVIVVHYYAQWRPVVQQTDLIVAVALALAVTLIASPLAYYLIEKPFIELGKKQRTLLPNIPTTDRAVGSAQNSG